MWPRPRRPPFAGCGWTRCTAVVAAAAVTVAVAVVVAATTTNATNATSVTSATRWRLTADGHSENCTVNAAAAAGDDCDRCRC